MELIKKNIHMDKRKGEASTEIILESDTNVPDSKPDIMNVALKTAQVEIDEVIPFAGKVSVKGRLHFFILYSSDGAGSQLENMDGYISFEEKLAMPSVSPDDSVYTKTSLDDLSVIVLNSRKIRIQSVVSLTATSSEICDFFIPMAVESTDPVEYHTKQLSLSKLVVCRDEEYHIREEILLPSGYPNIRKVLWKELTLRELNFRLLDDKIALQGELYLFIMYEADNEEAPVYSYETIIPISGSMECEGCQETSSHNISYFIKAKKISVIPDIDGEERSIIPELTMDIPIRIYETENTNMLTDVYGVTKDIETVNQSISMDNIFAKTIGRTRITEQLKLDDSLPGVMQILHSNGEASISETKISDAGLLLSGYFTVNILYITGNDDAPYSTVQGHFPFEYLLEIGDMQMDYTYSVDVHAEQVQVGVLDGSNLDIKGVVVFNAVIFNKLEFNLIDDINESEIDKNYLKSLPCLTIYVVKSGDSLWKIGKKYYVTVDSIMKTNNLESDLIYPGQKLLIVR